ncbi:MAG: 2-amino-4-hydroxy-6-hydroxymethyldihydropteridine diphosphokinase [Desulfovibrio sp.]|nr:2-amino-4-hydroxy-6-hydroxymethyldihydropteridine diphosphokinase [Desulfovibrio sp.]
MLLPFFRPGPGRPLIWLSLGSNSPAAPAMLARARAGIAALPGCELLAASSIYETEPQGYADQPWFHNQVLAVTAAETDPVRFLASLLALETRLGRRRAGPRFGPRCIDIDLLLFGDALLAEPVCALPHPRLCERAFCLVPMLELAPDLVINGVAAADLLARLAYRREGNKIFQ